MFTFAVKSPDRVETQATQTLRNYLHGRLLKCQTTTEILQVLFRGQDYFRVEIDYEDHPKSELDVDHPDWPPDWKSDKSDPGSDPP